MNVREYDKMIDRANREIRAAESAPLIFVLILTGIAFFIAHSCGQQSLPVNPTQETPQELRNQIVQMFMDAAESRRTPLPIDAEVQWLKSHPNEIQNVPRIMSVIRRLRVRDVNADGLVNCIDYSILFRELYGSNARLIINVNRRTGMNHMFIRIYYNGGVMDVEPQGTPTMYSMGLIWGVAYDYTFNTDVTSQWTQVVGGM